MAAIGAAYLATRVGVVPGPELGEVFWGAASGFAAVAAVGAGRRVWRVEHAAVPPPRTIPPPVPAKGSAAYPSLVRLAARERALAQLLGLLACGPDDTWSQATHAAATLRSLAGRIVTLELTRRSVPPEAAAGLDTAIGALRSRLEEGVSAYDRLVSAAADAVAADVTGGHGVEAAILRRLGDATDALSGLARGLREVAGPVPSRSHPGAG